MRKWFRFLLIFVAIVMLAGCDLDRAESNVKRGQELLAGAKLFLPDLIVSIVGGGLSIAAGVIALKQRKKAQTADARAEKEHQAKRTFREGLMSLTEAIDLARNSDNAKLKEGANELAKFLKKLKANTEPWLKDGLLIANAVRNGVEVAKTD